MMSPIGWFTKEICSWLRHHTDIINLLGDSKCLQPGMFENENVEIIALKMYM